jgi:1,2-diacylglycerol 3-alpha-glucosyltransferase/glucuronosyltransferase
MHILIATDAWLPQINGVVRTYQNLERELTELGHKVSFIVPSLFRTIPCPTYPDIRLSITGPVAIAREIKKIGPDHIHIATEGPIGILVRAYCRKNSLEFTTCYHTRFPEYISSRFPIPLSWTYALQRRFHNAACTMMVATRSLEDDLTKRGYENIRRWTRGVDTDLYRPRKERLFGNDHPVFIYVGRVAVEKNIQAFLELELPGKKVVVGSGPHLQKLQDQYGDVLFTGPKEGEELARHYASADVFVFPSKTDTFGVVLLEAMACGLPIAAYPITGPIDVVKNGSTGILDDDLQTAALAALDLDADTCRQQALEYSWSNSTQQFLQNIKSC